MAPVDQPALAPCATQITEKSGDFTVETVAIAVTGISLASACQCRVTEGHHYDRSENQQAQLS